MPTREQLIEQYGGWDNLPDYLRKGFEQQDLAQDRRDEQLRNHEAEQEAERERIKALRRPPRHVHLVAIGRLTKIRWSPPETEIELPPAGYWVSEERNGSWTKHGDYLLPNIREATLFGDGPAYVETVYHQTALGEMYRSPIASEDDSDTRSIRKSNARPLDLLDREWVRHHLVLKPDFPDCLLEWRNRTGPDTQFNGKIAGPTIHSSGYRHVCIQGRQWKQHIIIFCLHHDIWTDAELIAMSPDGRGGDIDHKDRISYHNHWDNLHVTDARGNGSNRSDQSTYGPGVRLHLSGRFEAATTHDGAQHSLGYYDAPEQAQAAYRAGVEAFHIEATREQARAAAKAAGEAVALGESYPSPVVKRPTPEAIRRDPVGETADPSVVATIRGYLAETHGRPPAYYERWTRALAGLGVEEHADPMTAAEAQEYAARGWGRWKTVAAALKTVEDARA